MCVKSGFSLLRLALQSIALVLLFGGMSLSNPQTSIRELPRMLIQGEALSSGRIAIQVSKDEKEWFSDLDSFKRRVDTFHFSPTFADDLSKALKEAQDSFESRIEHVEEHLYVEVLGQHTIEASRYLLIARSDSEGEFSWFVPILNFDEIFRDDDHRFLPLIADAPCRKISPRCYLCPNKRVICLGQRLSEQPDRAMRLFHVE